MRQVSIVVHPGFTLLDLAGPAEAFDVANQVLGTEAYAADVVSPGGGQVSARNGISVGTTAVSADGPRVDTMLVAGGWPLVDAPIDPALVEAIGHLAARSRRVGSVCTGAFALAATGLLSRRRATTHWLAVERLQTAYADITVEDDPIYVRDGRVWSSAGVTAGIDLAIAMVAADHGHEVAGHVARGLVMYLHRPGGQSQFSTPLRAATPGPDAIRELLTYVDGSPAADLSVPALAERVSMSPRHFSRIFTEQTGISPGKYVERSRAEAARRLLETTDDPHDLVARRCGLGTPETLYRVFQRLWRVSPGDHRRRFRTTQLEVS